MWQTRAGDEEYALEVGVDELVPVRVGRVFERDAGGVHARAIEDVVDAAEFRDRCGNEGFDLRCRADVDLVCERWGGKFGRERLERGEVDVAEGDGGAKGGHFEGGCAAGKVLVSVELIMSYAGV